MESLPAPDRPRPPGVHRRDLDEDQYGAASWLGATRATLAHQGPAGPLEDHDLPGRVALRSRRRSLAARGADQWRDLPALRREGARPNTPPRRRRLHGQPRQPSWTD